MDTILGIDLGTTNSVIAYMEGDNVKIIPNKLGNAITPSVVAFTEDGILVGTEAKNQAVTNPTKTIASIKRVVGLRVKEIPESAKAVSYTLVGRPDDAVQVLIGDRAFMPQVISAKVLTELKLAAEDKLGKPITDVVITVPAYFNDGQRQATKQAGQLAGLNVRRIINEPTAAALAYGFRDSGDKISKVAVFDLGGGTFDVSILEIGAGVFEVKSTNGDTFLGGDDFDREITNVLVRHFQDKTGIDLRDDLPAMQRLREAAERAKCELSNALSTTINLTFVVENEPKVLEYELTRAKFETLIQKYLARVEKCCLQALKDANFSAREVNKVVMVGGSTRIPIVKELARKIFKQEPDTSVNPDEVVALGAAIQGAILSGAKKDMVLVDVTPLSLGIETENELMDVLIPRNTPIPCSIKEIYTTTEDGQEEVDVFVYQGEHRIATKNRLLAQFVLDGIEPAESGDPQIEVRFSIDTDGILQVSAKNMNTGSEQSVTIKGSASVTEEDLQKAQQDAAESSEEEEIYVELVELLQTAESLLEETEEGMEELKETLDADKLASLQTAKAALEKALEEEDPDKVGEATEALLELWDTISESLEE